jgi:glutamine amidotransferase
MGNLRSVVNAFDALGETVCVTKNPQDLKKAAAIVLPGVGAFGKGMENLRRLNFIDTLNEQVIAKGKPYLGLCLGMQFLARESNEFGRHEGLGWLKGVVRKLHPAKPGFKVPHMGWNNVEVRARAPLFEDMGDSPVFYFVHSLMLQMDKTEQAMISATCWHGETVTASVQQGNIYGVQFHPEKSQQDGLKLLENFRRLL